MNEEVEKLKDKINGFLDKQGIEQESKYFLLLSMVEELKDEILDDDDEEEDEPEEEPEEFEDFNTDGDDPTKDYMEKQEISEKDLGALPELEDPKEPAAKSNHNLKMKTLLNKKKD